MAIVVPRSVVNGWSPDEMDVAALAATQNQEGRSMADRPNVVLSRVMPGDVPKG